jgi:polysaccharide chain length determinant protein (PEP-CTERM system associated)
MLGHRTLTPQDYFNILKKRSWIVVIPAVVLGIVGTGLTFFVPPRYVSQALVIIEQQKVPDSIVKSMVTEDLNSRLASMQEQIESRARLQPVIEKFNLYGAKGMGMDARIDAVRKDIKIMPIESQIARSGGLPGFYISFTAPDAHTAQQVCAEITSLFISASLSEQARSAEGTTEFVRGQLDEAKRALDDQDAKLAEFQRQYMGKLPDQEQGNLSMLSTLSSQLDAVTQTIAQLQQNKNYGEALLAQQLRAETPGATGPRVQPQTQQRELDGLLATESDLALRYTESWPDLVAVRRKIADLRAEMAKPQPPPEDPAESAAAAPKGSEPMDIFKLRQQLKAQDLLIEQKKHDQGAIQAQLRQYQDRVSASPEVQEQFKQITRDHETALEFYNDLRGKMNNSNMATALERRQQGETFKLMDEANLPDGPDYPKRSVFMTAGLAAGIALGLLIVGWIEYRDTAVRSEQDLWSFTKLPTLAVISLAAEIAPREPRSRFRIGGSGKAATASKPLMNAGG